MGCVSVRLTASPAAACRWCCSGFRRHRHGRGWRRGQMQELPFHRIDLGEICRDVMIAATFPGHQGEAAARECRRWTCAAQMNYRSQLLPLMTADFRLAAMVKNRRDVAVQEYRRKLSGMAWHDPRMERVAETAGLNHGMVENAIALRLRPRGVGHLIHADSARGRLVDRERIRGQTPPPIGPRDRIAGAFHLSERGQQLRRDRGGRITGILDRLELRDPPPRTIETPALRPDSSLC